MSNSRPELVAEALVDGADCRVIVSDWTEWGGDKPFEVDVFADHYSAARRSLDQVSFRSLDDALAYCLERYGVREADWRSATDVRFPETFSFESGVTNLGVPQPFPFGFEGAEVVFRLGSVEHEDEPSTPVLHVTGNREGLQRLAALLLLCADSERFDSQFHVHLEREGDGFISGDIDVDLRAPAYMKSFRDRIFRTGGTTFDFERKTELKGRMKAVDG